MRNPTYYTFCIAPSCLFLYTSLPFSISGYSALFRHPNDELNFCVYIIPGNPKVTDSDLPYWYDKLVKEDPNISRALGKSAKIERMRVGEVTRCPHEKYHGFAVTLFVWLTLPLIPEDGLIFLYLVYIPVIAYTGSLILRPSPLEFTLGVRIIALTTEPF